MTDTVVVAARGAYDFYHRYSAYVCQAGRSFRRNPRYLAFYRQRRIEREIPRICARRDHVTFTMEDAERLRASGSREDSALADVIERTLKSGARIHGVTYQVFLLSAPEDAGTHRLSKPIPHYGGTAWTRGQRYASLDALLAATTTDSL